MAHPLPPCCCRVPLLLLLLLQLSRFPRASTASAPPLSYLLQVAGEEVEIEEFVEEEDEDTVKHSTKALANRESFVNMGKNLKQKVRGRGRSVGGEL